MYHSERGKASTKKQITSIITFLEKNLLSYQKEYNKYNALSVSFAKDALKVINKNILATKKSLEYYLALKEEYRKDGLI